MGQSPQPDEQPDLPIRADSSPDEHQTDQVPEIQSCDLLRGHRELLIHHAGETYRLRLTRTGKLILNK